MLLLASHISVFTIGIIHICKGLGFRVCVMHMGVKSSIAGDEGWDARSLHY